MANSSTIHDDTNVEQLSLTKRIHIRIILIAAVIIITIQVASSVVNYINQVESAEKDLLAKGQSLLPFMESSIRPALEMALDPLSNTFNEDLLPKNIVQETFNIVKKNQDLVYADLLLNTGSSIAPFISPEVSKTAITSAYRMNENEKTFNTGDLIALQTDIYTQDGSTKLANLRISFSLSGVKERINVNTYISTGLGLFFFIIGIAMIMFLGVFTIYNPMNALLKNARDIANGNLTTQINTKISSEVGLLAKAFSAMANELGTLIGGVQNTAKQVVGTVQLIGNSSQDMLQGAEQQTESIRRVVSSAEEMQHSNLTIDKSIEELTTAATDGSASTYELSQQLNTITPQLAEFNSFVQETNTAMQEMAASATQIDTIINQMAKETDESASSVSQLERSIQLVEENANQAAELAQNVTRRAEEGQIAVEKSDSGMSQIAQSFSAIEQAINRLGDSIESISNIIQVINEIAAQTKLLSLNASILAGQSGEHGKGFAVVADEIKALSDRTNNSTREIAELIEAVRREHDSTTKAMESGIHSVREGQKLTKQVIKEIETILEQTGESHVQMRQIAKATTEQVKSGKLITDAIKHIAEMGNMVAKATNEQNKNSDHITSLTAKMVNSIGVVHRTIEENANVSTQVANHIAMIHNMAEKIRSESQNQKEHGNQIVNEMDTIHNVAQQVLTQVQAVADSVTGLNQNVSNLSQKVEHFQVE